MQPYYEHNGITIYLGDCRNVLPHLTETASLVLTDPPYGVNERTDRKSKGRGQAAKCYDFAPVAGDNKPFDPTVLLTLSSKIIIWGANHFADKLPISATWLVWDKRDGIPSNDNADCEMAWTNLGGPARLYHHRWNGMIKASEQRNKRTHPTQKPVALMRWCLSRAKLQPGALVLDPYMGSGPVARACHELGYRYIGIELVEQYCEAAVGRLSQGVMKLETTEG